MEEGLSILSLMVDGVAFLDVMTREDEPTGDTDGFILRPAEWYRERFARAGLVHLGMQCYEGPALAEVVAELEKV